MHCNIASCNACNVAFRENCLFSYCAIPYSVFSWIPYLRITLLLRPCPSVISTVSTTWRQESCSNCLIGWFSFISHEWGQTHTDIVDKSNFNRPDMCLVYKSLNTFYWLCMKTKIFNAYCFGLKTSNDEISLNCDGLRIL